MERFYLYRKFHDSAELYLLIYKPCLFCSFGCRLLKWGVFLFTVYFAVLSERCEKDAKNRGGAAAPQIPLLLCKDHDTLLSGKEKGDTIYRCRLFTSHLIPKNFF